MLALRYLQSHQRIPTCTNTTRKGNETCTCNEPKCVYTRTCTRYLHATRCRVLQLFVGQRDGGSSVGCNKGNRGSGALAEDLNIRIYTPFEFVRSIAIARQLFFRYTCSSSFSHSSQFCVCFFTHIPSIKQRYEFTWFSFSLIMLPKEKHSMPASLQ